jgi:double-stranded uracil-DNA glycosylase
MLTGFPPIVDDRARALVLGSMPGALSLQQREYYAHPRNLFWRITAELVGFDADADYRTRTAALCEAGIALWDVLHTCQRHGSLDTAIARDSVAANDFEELLAARPGIERVFFNGAKAEELFRRLVLPLLGQRFPLTVLRLPSTSPANASISYDLKLAAWRAIMG